MVKKAKRFIAFFLFVTCASIIIWASLPVKRMVERKILPSSSMRLKRDGEDRGVAILETRQVRLEWPESMRIGDKATISLDFETVPSEMDAESQSGLTNAYHDYSLMAEGRYEVAGVRVNPINPIRESMPEGKPVRFKWVIRADEEGQFDGRVWLSLRFIPHNGSTPENIPIYVKDIRLETTGILGLSGLKLRILSGGGVFISIMLLFSDMIRWTINRGGRGSSMMMEEKIGEQT